MEWCIFMHMMWLKGKTNVRKNSGKKTDHRSFEMGNWSLLSLYCWCWGFPLHKVVTVWICLTWWETCLSPGGSVISHHYGFSSFPDFPLTGLGSLEWFCFLGEQFRACVFPCLFPGWGKEEQTPASPDTQCRKTTTILNVTTKLISKMHSPGIRKF